MFGFEITTMPDATQFIAYGPTAVLLLLVLTFLWKVAPVWKEVKLRELDIRAAEAGTMEKVATALGSLASVLQAIGVDQRRATENIELMQRVNIDAEARLTASLNSISARLETVEAQHHNEVLVGVQGLTERMDRIEHVDTSTGRPNSQ